MSPIIWFLSIISVASIIVLIYIAKSNEYQNEKAVSKRNYVSIGEIIDSILQEIRSEVRILQSSAYPDCEKLILDYANESLRQTDFSSWDYSKVNLHSLSLYMIYSFSYNLMSSGKYHISAGEFTQTGNQLIQIMFSSLEKSVQLHYISNEQYANEINGLINTIMTKDLSLL